MSGSNLPYQLRPNKAIDRSLFVDALSRINRCHTIENYQYIGFGGPQMVDFRLVHESFDKIDMICIEEEPYVIKRQRFNQPHTQIKIVNKTSSDFINDYAFRKHAVVWLDYTKPAYKDQIADVQNVLKKLKKWSVLKVTFNANPSSISTSGSVTDEGLPQARFARLSDEVGAYFPAGTVPSNISWKNFPKLLTDILQNAALETLRDRGLTEQWRLHPVASFYYADGQQMMTFIGLVVDQDIVDAIAAGSHSALTQWDHYSGAWNKPIHINVPELTPKERICLAQLLPAGEDQPQELCEKIKFELDKNKNESQEMFEHFVKYRRYYPQYAHVYY